MDGWNGMTEDEQKRRVSARGQILQYCILLTTGYGDEGA